MLTVDVDRDRHLGVCISAWRSCGGGGDKKRVSARDDAEGVWGVKGTYLIRGVGGTDLDIGARGLNPATRTHKCAISTS